MEGTCGSLYDLLRRSFELDEQSEDEQRWDRLFGCLDRRGCDPRLLHAVRVAQEQGQPYPGSFGEARRLLERLLAPDTPAPGQKGRVGVVRAPGTPESTEGPRTEP